MNRERTRATRDGRARLDDERFGSEEDLDAAPLSGIRAVRREAAPSTTPLVASQLIELHARLDQLNHFELLDVPETADRQSVRRAFEQQARRFHPDRIGGDDERLRRLAAKVFLRMAEAYRVLENDSTRKQYRSSSSLRGRTGARAQSTGCPALRRR